MVRLKAVLLLLCAATPLVNAGCPNWCSQHGICNGAGDDATCECEMGYVGDDCGTRLCPKGDDPLTKDQASRTVQLVTGATRGTLAGQLQVTFNGETAVFDAAAGKFDGAACSKAISALPNVQFASCQRISTNEWSGGTYEIAFDAWPTIPWENNLFSHNGNPPLSAFACNMSSISADAWAPWCELSDVAVGPLKEYAECSNHGVCERAAATCHCSLGFHGLACDDMTDADDITTHTAEGPFFTAAVLKVRAARGASAEYRLIEAVAGESTALALSGTGNLAVSGSLSAPAAVIGTPLVSGEHTAAAQAALAVTVGSTLYSKTAVAVAIESPAPGAALLQLTAGNSGEGLRVGADGSGAVFTGAGGVTVQQGGLAVTEGDALLGGNVTVSGALRADGSVSGAAVTALSGGLQAALTAATGAAATVSAQHSDFTGDVLSLALAREPASASGNDTAAAGATAAGAALLRASSGGVERFSIAADGATAVHYGGLAVKQGGVTVGAGGVHVESGGLEVKGGITLLSGELKLTTPQGLDVAGGGLRASTSEPTAAALTAAATAAGYAGAVLRVEAAHAAVGAPFKLVQGVVAGAAVLNVTSAGDVQTAGSVSAQGSVTAGGLLISQSGTVFARTSIPAGAVIDASEPAAAGAFLSIADDGAVAANKLLLPSAATTSAGRLLLLHNGDAQATSGAAVVPPGYTVLFVHDGTAWQDLRVIDAAVTRLQGVTTLTAAADLDIGDQAFKARALLAGGAPSGHVAVYGSGGLLTAAQGLTWDAATSVVTVPKLKIVEMAGGVDFRGMPAKNMALTNVTIDELPFLKAHRILLASAATAAAPAAGTTAVRFAGLDAKGELSALDAPFTLLEGLVPHAKQLSADNFKAGRITADMDLQGHAVRAARLEGVLALTGLQQLALAESLTIDSLVHSAGSLLLAGTDGAVTAAQGVTLHQGVLSLEPKLRVLGGIVGGVDLTGGTLSNAVLQSASVDGVLTGGVLKPEAIETPRAALGATTMTGALDLAGQPLLNMRAEDIRAALASSGYDQQQQQQSVRELQELTVAGELRLGGREAVRGRLLVVGQDGAIVPAQADRLAVECDTLAAGRVTAASLTAAASITAAAVEAADITATGSLRAAKLTASALQLDGDADGGGYRLSNIALDRVSSLTGVRALTLDGDLTLSELAGSTKEGSLLHVGPGGSGRVTAGSLKWTNETLEVPRLTGHHVSGDVDMEGHVLKGVRLDVSAGGSIEGLQDLRVQGALHVGEDSFVAGSLTVGGSVLGGGPYMDSSDARFKTAVSTVTGALATVKQLRGVTYDWDGASHPSRGFPAGRQLGLLAQEVEAVLPLLVGKDSEGYSTVAYSRLTPVLVEAVKELDAQNSELAARLSAAESRLQQLEAVVQLLLKDATAAAATSS